MIRIRVAAALAALTVILALPGAASAVTGGTPPSRDYPHMAVILNDGSQWCGGSLVDPNTVLTAAHCVKGQKLTALSLQIGGKPMDNPEEVRTPVSANVHESFDEDTLEYDVALLRLNEPSANAPIALADPATQQSSLWAPDQPARVIGYGLPNTDEIGMLFETDVPMVSDEDCELSYTFTGTFDPTTMVCAGELYGVKDSCFGDSGGPLMAPTAGDFDGTLVQVGVVSWGFACGVPTQYGVYSRVGDQPLHDWIQARIGGSSPSPGGIEGQVSDSRSDAGLSSATVSCGGGHAATSAGDGDYSLGGVPVGTYTCTASKGGYSSKSESVTVPSGSTATADFALRPSSPGNGKKK